MSPDPSATTLDRLLDAPVERALLSVTPLLLAVAQLANSYLNGLSPVVAIGFAACMLVFAVVATGHSTAEHRLRELERGLDPDE